ncbi:hypothetical protein ACS0TY_027494 [Phlomoides rotata]
MLYEENLKEKGDAHILDLPHHGRRFTSYKTVGSCKSRLDCMLWPNSRLKAQRRYVSDHCPILMEVKVANWGPKPFRCLNAWFLKEN